MSDIMVHYRRNHQPDGLYFFTVTLKNRSSTLLTDQIILLKKSLQRVQKEHPYKIKAIVVLPDHIHAIWQMHGDDQNYSLRWSKIKSYFTNSLKSAEPIAKNSQGNFDIWQNRFWEHGLVKHVKDWLHSSFHRYVKQGLLDFMGEFV